MEGTTLFFSIVGAAAGLCGMVLGIISFFHSRFEVVHSFLSAIEEPAFTEARAAVMNTNEEETIDLQKPHEAIVINFFHHWGLLARKGYLPLWVFDYGSGAGVIRYYEILKDRIETMRNTHNDPSYASGFEWLYNKMKKRKNHKL